MVIILPFFYTSFLPDWLFWSNVTRVIDSRLPCFIFCICILTNRNPKCKSVKLGSTYSVIQWHSCLEMLKRCLLAKGYNSIYSYVDHSCGSRNEKLSKSPAKICANGCMYIMTTNHRVFPSWQDFSFGGIDRRKKTVGCFKTHKGMLDLQEKMFNIRFEEHLAKKCKNWMHCKTWIGSTNRLSV